MILRSLELVEGEICLLLLALMDQSVCLTSGILTCVSLSLIVTVELHAVISVMGLKVEMYLF